MKFLKVVFIAWWFMAAGGTHQNIGVQFGPFKDETVCKRVAEQERKHIFGWEGYSNSYISECWEG